MSISTGLFELLDLVVAEAWNNAEKTAAQKVTSSAFYLRLKTELSILLAAKSSERAAPDALESRLLPNFDEHLQKLSAYVMPLLPLNDAKLLADANVNLRKDIALMLSDRAIERKERDKMWLRAKAAEEQLAKYRALPQILRNAATSDASPDYGVKAHTLNLCAQLIEDLGAPKAADDVGKTPA